MNINEMTHSDIEERKAQIAVEMNNDGADIDALTEEVRKMNARDEELRAAAKKAEELRNLVATGSGQTVRTFTPDVKEKRSYDSASPEYRTAWLKNLAIDSRGNHMFGDMTTEERVAFTFTTANTTSIVPKDIQNRIVELVRSQYPMYTDASKTFFEKGFGVPRHKAIAAGDAKETTEGEAPDDENDTFDLLDITGVEIKKVVEMSRKMQFQSIDAFQSWITEHIAKRIGVAKEKRIISQLDNVTYGMDATNAAMTGTLSDAEVRKIFAAIDQDGEKVVYANAETIWNVIAALENKSGDKLFIPSTMGDPLITGRVYGAAVKADANIPKDTIYVGVPTSILANEFSELEIFSAIEPKTCKTIYTGYSIFDAGLENPKAFVKYKHTGSLSAKA